MNASRLCFVGCLFLGMAVRGECAPTKEPAAIADPGALEKDYVGKFGTHLSITVTGATDGPVWGTGPYTLDSTLAAAAVHAGVLKAGDTGVVQVEIVKPPASFGGSDQNGVTSQNWGAFPDGAFQFILPDPGSLSNGGYAGKFGTKLAILVTGVADGPAWGTGPYTVDSTLAVAAVHAGVIKVGDTGVVHVEIVKPPASFNGSTQNGVKTDSWGAFPDGGFKFIKPAR